MFNRYRNCSCMNNNNDNIAQSAIEESCQNECGCNCNDIEECNCGFDEETNILPENPSLAQSYVPNGKQN